MGFIFLAPSSKLLDINGTLVRFSTVNSAVLLGDSQVRIQPLASVTRDTPDHPKTTFDPPQKIGQYTHTSAKKTIAFRQPQIPTFYFDRGVETPAKAR